jgi:prepilin-type N-terminal cleavage/methylation domain-containing protein
MRTRRRGGLTLIEIMVVMVCLAIVAMLVMPTFSSVGSTQLRAAAETLVADLEYAQEQSIAHADDCRMVVFDVSKNSYWIAPSSTPTVPVTHPIDKQPFLNKYGVGRCAYMREVSIDAFDLGGDDRMLYRGLGQLDQSVTATITLRAGKNRVKVSIDPTTGEASVGAMY